MARPGASANVTDDRLQRSRTLIVRHNLERGASSPESDPEMASLLEKAPAGRDILILSDFHHSGR